ALNPNGANAISVVATDVAGNTSAAGTQTLTIDTAPPVAPFITSGSLTGNALPIIQGFAEPGSMVTVEVGGATYVVTAATGLWSLDLGTATSIAGTLVLNTNGVNEISAVATDVAGNV